MQRIPSLFVAPSDVHGRGVFTNSDISKKTILEICPVIVVPEKDVDLIHKTALHDYYFHWGDDQKDAAIVLGFGSIYNHSFKPNAEYIVDYEQRTMDFYAIRPIKAGEEITVNYNGEEHNNDPLWFNDNE